MVLQDIASTLAATNSLQFLRLVLDGDFVDLFWNTLSFEHTTSHWHNRDTGHLFQNWQARIPPRNCNSIAIPWTSCDNIHFIHLQRALSGPPCGFFASSLCRWCKRCNICERLLWSGCNHLRRCLCADMSADGILSFQLAAGIQLFNLWLCKPTFDRAPSKFPLSKSPHSPAPLRHPKHIRQPAQRRQGAGVFCQAQRQAMTSA